MSLTAVAVLRPLYTEAGETIRDFAWVSLNPAGQRLLMQPECPTESLLTLFPTAQAAGGDFALFCQAFVTGELTRTQTNYQADGLDSSWLTVAQRYENVLIVNFTATNEPPRLAGEVALRERQASEQAALAKAERERTQLDEAPPRLPQLNQELEARVQERTRALEQQRGELQAVFAQAPVAVCVFQGEANVLDVVNPPMAEMMGHPLADLVGRSMFEVMPELQSQELPALLAEVRRTGTPFVAQEREVQLGRHRPGEPGYFNFVYQPLLAADRTVTGIVCVVTDVTEQVWARQRVEQLNQELETCVQQRTQQLEEQQQQLQTIFEQAPVAIFVVQEPTHVLRVVNPAMSETLGRPVAALLGQPFAQALPELAQQGYLDLLDRVWRTGEPVTLAESPAQLPHHAPGETGYYTFVYQPLRDVHGQVTGILCVTVDVTGQVGARQQVQDLNEELGAINEELTATNEELHESNTRLLRTNADLDTFVYTASHDLKSPITNIEGLLLALGEVLPAEVQQGEVIAELLRLLHDTVGRFRATITQLTDLVRLQQSQQGPAEPVGLGPLVEAVCLDLAADIQAADATVHVELPAGLWVSFAPANLRSIVYNLLSNAVKYRAPDRPAQVWVAAERQASAVVLRVRDNGLGLDETQQRRLFQVFQRLHTHVEGTGVGLYMIKRLIENGGATIAVSSEPGVGTTFTVTFRA